MTSRLDEEGKQLLRRIIESMAYRQIASINILGSSLRYIHDLETKMRVASELDTALRLFREVHALHTKLGWTDLENVVRERVERIPVPGSRVEFGACFHLIGLAERVAMESYVESSSPEFAAIARSHLEASSRRPEPTRFLEFVSDPTNRPRAQQYLDLWSAVARRSFGRPGTKSDHRAKELGLRDRTAAELDMEYLRRLEPFVDKSGLHLPREVELEV